MRASPLSAPHVLALAPACIRTLPLACLTRSLLKHGQVTWIRVCRMKARKAGSEIATTHKWAYACVRCLV